MWLCMNGACGTVNPDTAETCTVCGASGLQVRLFKPGTMIGAYEIRRFVGHGGYGVVYEATRREADGTVLDIALKQTSLSDYRTLERELNLLEHVSHPNLPIYYEAFQHGGAGYLVMEFVAGLNLRELLTHAGGALGEKQVIQYALELCGAVNALHAQRPPLLHRDIKPANIRLTPAGRIKLVDFGLTKAGNEATRTTQQGATLGYAPWEQLTATSKTDERSDIYSMGATLYHLLTAQIPASSLERGIEGRDALIPPEQLNPALHGDIIKIVRKAMERKQTVRYQTVKELESALRRIAAPTQEAAPVIFAKEPFRLPMVWILLGLAAVLAVLALGINQFAGTTATNEPTAVVAAFTEVSSTNVPATSTSGSGGGTNGEDATSTPSPRTTTTAPIIVVEESPTLAAPTSTALPLPSQYAFLSVAPIANGTSDFATPPLGRVDFGGIPFEVGNAIFKSQADVEPWRIAPTEARLTTNLTGATRLFLLLNTGNGKPEYEGDVIGAIFATCDGAELRVSDLILGENIREWHSDENVVGSAPLPSQVFEGGRTDNSERRGHIDLLTFDLPAACLASLTAITLRDTSADSVGSLDPAINWTGATVEYSPEY
jgi:serine/threonine protein kinase